jgi:hypothetical protein
MPGGIARFLSDLDLLDLSCSKANLGCPAADVTRCGGYRISQHGLQSPCDYQHGHLVVKTRESYLPLGSLCVDHVGVHRMTVDAQYGGKCWSNRVRYQYLRLCELPDALFVRD